MALSALSFCLGFFGVEVYGLPKRELSHINALVAELLEAGLKAR